MTVLLPFLVNAALNFALGLLIALFLGPKAFGLYAIGAALVVLVNTAALDWLKLSAVRFYTAQARASDPGIRATLDLLFAGVALVLGLLLAVALSAGFDGGLPPAVLAAAVLAGIGAGWFDYHGAIARARFLDAAYGRLIAVRAGVVLVLMVGGAWATRDPAVVLLAGLAGTIVSVLSVRGRLSDGPLSIARARSDLARDFLRYGLPLVAGNAVYSLIPLVNRSLLAQGHGLAESGYFSLASDIGLRLFPMLATMLEIVLLREVIRLDETRGRAAARKRIAANMVLVLGLVLPAALGFWLLLPAFEALFVPPDFRGHFAGPMALLLPGFAALALFQAAIYPVFLLEKRTLVAALVALLGLAVNLALAFGPIAASSPLGYALAQSAGFVAVLLVTTAVALRSLPRALPLRDLACVLLASAAMALAVWPLQNRLPPALELVLQLGLGTSVYAGIILACDVARLRTGLKLRWLMRKAGSPRKPS